ncbi:hypothetical protein CMI44_02590 [Candidatus Pacearchaeota archaeon]|nr:hypothetical protein [Candidatus Pacearchaeota archaeon]|tara:strand:- start:288 stop:998 length:711 start_codon:yes stop_codon:yes gene_type:complete
MTHNLEEGDVVLCTVDRIIGTIVFVKIKGSGEGNIITSEIAPGRIRNLRDYVVPKKKIVCKVLRIKGNQINLSLRRVTQKEKKEVLDQHKQEKSYKSILKTILKEKAGTTIEQIKKEDSIYDFFEEVKNNPKKLEKITGKTDSKKILKILSSQKEKKSKIKKEFSLTTSAPDGLQLIKKVLEKIKDVEIKYISAGRYSIKAEAEDVKKANNRLKEILSEIGAHAKKENMEFEVKEK